MTLRTSLALRDFGAKNEDPIFYLLKGIETIMIIAEATMDSKAIGDSFRINFISGKRKRSAKKPRIMSLKAVSEMLITPKLINYYLEIRRRH